MIYKTWFGKHIDLSKIISISDAHTRHRTYSTFWEFEIHCALLDNPITYTEGCLKLANEFETPERNNKILEETGYKEFQQKIDDLVKVWKDFKEQEKQFK